MGQIAYDFVIDESVDATISFALEQNKFLVFAVSKNAPAIKDDEVLAIAYQSKALLITEDKDFGELVIRFNKPNHGILLIRLSGISSEEKSRIVLNAIKGHLAEMKNTFSVLDKNKLRIKGHY